ncbi:MAG TPA: dTDP-4-dehydrorhamnose reductase [Terriglobia bacterium]|nr:dTDP-4-dehydrorhamnose reductase [Terriglobia bacterium]
MRICIVGANGQLGRDLTNTLAGHDVLPLTRKDFDVTDHVRAREIVTAARPEMLVNLSAYHRVDDCEANPALAYSVNVLSVLNLVRIANDLDAKIVQISTDYVFDGNSTTPYTEASEPFPLSVYGNSRLAGEYLVRSQAKRFLLIRTCGLYGHAGSQGKGGNFVETMLRKARAGEPIQVVNDQTVTPTSTANLARQLALLFSTQNEGLFHVTNEGACTWYEFAAATLDIAGVSANLTPTTSAAYKAPARRPQFSVLENKRLKDLGLNRMLPWRDALAEYLG